MSIRSKLIVGYASMMLIIIGFGVASIVGNNHIERHAEVIIDHGLTEVLTGSKLRQSVQTLELRLKDLRSAYFAQVTRGLPAEGPESPIPLAQADLDSALRAVRHALVEATKPPVERAQVDEDAAYAEAHEIAMLEDLAAEFTALEEDARRIHESPGVRTVGGIRPLFDRLFARLSERVMPQVVGLENDAKVEVLNSFNAIKRSTAIDNRVELVATLLGILVAVIIGILTARSIFAPIKTLREAALRIGDGDLETLVSLPERNEMSTLADALNTMAAHRKQAEIDIRGRQVAEAANAAKSQFLANMSHEIRTPLNGVLGMAELLAGTPLEANQREFLDVIQKSADSLFSVVEAVLDFSQIQAGELAISHKAFDVRQELNHAMRLFALPAQQKGLLLLHHVAPTVPPLVVGDGTRLRQVVLNLVSNAIKFTERGAVTVAVDGESQTDVGIVLHLAVTDTGIGVPAHKQQIVFEAFEQVDGSATRKYGGTGLGLAISAKLAERMGGRIWVDSSVGRGSSFHFTAPFGVAEAPNVSITTASPVADGGAASPPTSLAPRHVLLAEDNPINQKVAVSLLTRLGYEVTVASDGRQALTTFMQQRFDVILMDVHMPEMGGLQATKAIRDLEHAQGIHTPIVALTAAAMPEDRAACFAAGMDDYLSKPIQLKPLKETLERVTGATSSADAPIPCLA